MFEAAELGHKLTKEDFEALEPDLRLALIDVQQRLRQANLPVVIVFAGVDGGGKGETVNVLSSWLDPRWTVTRAYGTPSEEEAERPPFWRYWRDLPPKGKIGFFLSAWYSRPVIDCAYGTISEVDLDQRLARIRTFEQILADDGTLILKYWMHLDKKAQKKRLRVLESDPLQSWRVTPQDWKHYELYPQFIAAAERLIMRTSTGDTPWTIIEGRDPEYRVVTVARDIHQAIEKRLATHSASVNASNSEAASESASETSPEVNEDERKPPKTILQALDMSLALPKKQYNDELQKQQARVGELFRLARERRLSALLLFEGWDAAGKGGAIRRLTSALDARNYQVIPIAAPTDEEGAQHYLWRFWRHLSRAGRVTLFDRSWYGRVLVERIEGFATEEEWRRAYAEINHFEDRLTAHGIVLCKYWLHITKEEQLARFKAREETPFKRWKLTDEDWRNRDRWDAYEISVNEMIARTSTRSAPWTLVEANNKRYARVKVIETFADALEATLDKARSRPKGKKKKKR
ncbi:MAG: polyphosphate:AMP phosphotransferase [Deltaproteobacteria bacterium]|nr:polyphosphate:AMP phosphotransferase [Deltaproteobacteria bacterium]